MLIANTYRVESLLGRGGTSRVLQVVDTRSGVRTALKHALPASSPGQQSRAFALFRQEYHVLSQLVHPNVVAVGEYGFEDERPFYTMELLRVRRSTSSRPCLGARSARSCSISVRLYRCCTHGVSSTVT